jgi:hypothetical protein
VVPLERPANALPQKALQILAGQLTFNLIHQFRIGKGALVPLKPKQVSRDSRGFPPPSD